MREHGFAVEVIHPAVDERHELQAGEAPTGLAEALSAIKARNVAAKRTFFTHISHDLEHEATNAELPEGIELAYDGMRIPLNFQRVVAT